MSPSMKRKRAHCAGATQALHLVEVALVAGGEVVQADDRLVELQQGLEQVAADEAGDAGDQPCFGCFCEFTAAGCVGSVHGWLKTPIGFGNEEGFPGSRPELGECGSLPGLVALMDSLF